MVRFPASLLAAMALSLPLIAFAETAALPVPAAVVPESPAASAPMAVAPAPSEKKFRIGYVDIMKVAGESDAGKVAKSHFEAKADRYKAQIDTRQKMLEKQKANLEAKLPDYTPEQRAAKIKGYEKKVEELRRMLQKADQEMRPMQEELLKEVYAKIESAAQKYGAEKGFAAIIEKRQLLYLGKEISAEDVSEALIDELNKKTAAP